MCAHTVFACGPLNKMKIQLVSDLHLEFSPYALDCTGVDVLVLAGDTHCNIGKLHEYLRRLCAQFPELRIVYVAGNHECYGKTIPATLAQLQIDHPRCFALEASSVCLSGVWFVGGTLWCYPPPEFRPEIKHSLTDFVRIHDITWQELTERFDATLDAIETVYQQHPNEAIVAVTHFGPTLQSIHPKYRKTHLEAVNRYFSNDCSAFIADTPVTLWLHGHTHSSLDYLEARTRVVVNPRGYSNKTQRHEENPEFNDRLILTV